MRQLTALAVVAHRNNVVFPYAKEDDIHRCSHPGRCISQRFSVGLGLTFCTEVKFCCPLCRHISLQPDPCSKPESFPKDTPGVFPIIRLRIDDLEDPSFCCVTVRVGQKMAARRAEFFFLRIHAEGGTALGILPLYYHALTCTKKALRPKVSMQIRVNKRAHPIGSQTAFACIRHRCPLLH